METEFKIMQQKCKKLIESTYVNFEHVSSLKNITGVYLIYNEQKQIIYIGHTNKFNVRFGTDLKHETTHTLVRKLIKSGAFVSRQDVVAYLKTKCSMKIEICKDKREAEALECMAIYILQPKFNR